MRARVPRAHGVTATLWRWDSQLSMIFPSSPNHCRSNAGTVAENRLLAREKRASLHARILLVGGEVDASRLALGRVEVIGLARLHQASGVLRGQVRQEATEQKVLDPLVDNFFLLYRRVKLVTACLTISSCSIVVPHTPPPLRFEQLQR